MNKSLFPKMLTNILITSVFWDRPKIRTILMAFGSDTWRSGEGLH